MAKENGAPNTEMTGTPAYSKQIIDIADFLYKHPNKKISDEISVFCSKFQKTERTIWGYVKQAKKYNKTRIQKQEKAKDEVLAAEAKESLKKAIISRDESLEILSSIAKDSERDGDRIRAITVLAEINGWNAPVKTAQTDSSGNDIVSRITPQEAAEFIKEMTKEYSKE